MNGMSASTGPIALETRLQALRPHHREVRPPSTVARNTARPTRRVASVGEGVWAEPAKSFPRRSPGWPFVLSQTVEERGLDSITSSAFDDTGAQLFALYPDP